MQSAFSQKIKRFEDESFGCSHIYLYVADIRKQGEVDNSRSVLFVMEHKGVESVVVAA